MPAETRLWYAQDFPHESRIVILHPHFERQQLVLKDILGRSTPSFCLTIERDKTSFSQFWEELQTLVKQSLRVALPPLENSRGSAAKAAQTLIKMTKPLGVHTLVIDSYDLTDDETLDDFIVELAQGMMAGCQIVIGTRRLPVRLVEKVREVTSLRHQTDLFPVDDNRMLLDYVHRESAQTLLEVYAQGTGLAAVNGRVIEHWDGVLPRALFFYLVDRGMTTRDEIFQVFWPDLSVREATNVFHVTKRKISEILGFDLTVYWSGFYRVSPEIELQYDVVRFVEDVQNSAVAEDAQAIKLLENAVHLWRGAFLNTLDAAWVQRRRDDLRNTYIEALTALARLYEIQGESERALGLYHRAVIAMPHREDVARSIMALYDKMGQPERAIAVFQRLAIDLKREFNVSPDKRTVELAETLGYRPQPEEETKPRGRGRRAHG
ncbi:MAG: bacterial transcriptional activator domain-containing protein [Anaerolineae bacterium]|nr:bacterial transcriptional activator domain-containing protein [Anaerolineae bacterium]